MKYYENPADNSVHAYESDGSQDFIIDKTYIAITEAQADAIRFPLPAVKLDQIGILTVSYNLAISQPLSYKTGGGITQIFQATQTSRDNIQAMLAALTPTTMPPNFYWLSLDNTPIPFTYADIQNLAGLMGNQGWIGFTKLQDYKDQVREAQTVEDVKKIVWID